MLGNFLNVRLQCLLNVTEEGSVRT
ncbi:hypothetical protein FQN60_006416 [Etheostoma spectabile]|uniref:Uncharacterized protein n=1 Tax=Etheostoma spectabile TaxID=54343 RepID=A0A5J5CPY1_9PERO|nr:hypothetical protein FQN60_006416 [Etheostoma spectabile]